jgi:CDGSH-type Zn-finger protein
MPPNEVKVHICRAGLVCNWRFYCDGKLNPNLFTSEKEVKQYMAYDTHYYKDRKIEFVHTIFAHKVKEKTKKHGKS